MWKPWVQNSEVTVHCKDCTAECCKHIAIPIDEPQTLEDFQRIADYLHHGVSVYKDEDGDWLVEFRTRCTQLVGNRCKAWGEHHYPRICAAYEMKGCVMNVPGDYWVVLFDRPEQVAAFARDLGEIRTTPACAGDCSSIRIPLDAPESLRDYDDLWWYIAHAGVTIYCDAGRWYARLAAPRPCTCTPDPERHDVVLRSWEDIMAHCRRIGLLAQDRLVLTDMHEDHARFQRPAGA